jgi:hypothetical protein
LAICWLAKYHGQRIVNVSQEVCYLLSPVSYFYQGLGPKDLRFCLGQVNGVTENAGIALSKDFFRQLKRILVID